MSLLSPQKQSSGGIKYPNRNGSGSISSSASLEKLQSKIGTQSQQQMFTAEKKQRINSQHEDLLTQKKNTSYQSQVSPAKSTFQKPFSQSRASISSNINLSCEDCVAYKPEQRLRQVQLEALKLKAQNEALVLQLREINAQLDQSLEKLKPKIRDKPNILPSNAIPSEDVSLMELENVRNQIEQHSKKISNLTNIDQDFSSKRMNQLHNEILMVDAQIEDARIMNKNLEYLNRGQERTMASNQKENRLKLLRDEIVVLKNQIRMARRTAKDNESGFKKTQDHVNKLENRHKQVCQQFNVAFSPFESLPKEEKPSITIKEVDETTKEVITKIVTEETLVKMLQEVKIIEESSKSIKKQIKIERKKTQNRLSELEADNTKLDVMFSQKSKEIEEVTDHMNGFLTAAKNRSFSQIPSSQKYLTESMRGAKSNSVHLMVPYVKKYKDTRREVHGQLAAAMFGQNLKSFEDSKELPDTKDQTIEEVVFWYYEDMIMGLETIYLLSNGERVRVASFDTESSMNNALMKIASIKLFGSEYFNSIEGCVSNFCIEYLKFTTSRGNVLEVGSKKNWIRSKKFTYNIQKTEIPVSFFGSIDFCFANKKPQGSSSNNNTNNNSSSNTNNDRIKDYGKQESRELFSDTMMLINFGIEVRKKEMNSEVLKLLQKQPRAISINSSDINLLQNNQQQSQRLPRFAGENQMLQHNQYTLPPSPKYKEASVMAPTRKRASVANTYLVKNSHGQQLLSHIFPNKSHLSSNSLAQEKEGETNNNQRLGNNKPQQQLYHMINSKQPIQQIQLSKHQDNTSGSQSQQAQTESDVSQRSSYVNIGRNHPTNRRLAVSMDEVENQRQRDLLDKLQVNPLSEKQSQFQVKQQSQTQESMNQQESQRALIQQSLAQQKPSNVDHQQQSSNPLPHQQAQPQHQQLQQQQQQQLEKKDNQSQNEKQSELMSLLQKQRVWPNQESQLPPSQQSQYSATNNQELQKQQPQKNTGLTNYQATSSKGVDKNF